MAGSSILALPVEAFAGNFRWALLLTAFVVCECAVLAANRGRCPLTDWAARFTGDRAANFDIYLPNWLARHNKAIFGHPVCSERVDCALALAGSTVKGTLKASVLYFVLVFAAGFVLGTIRTLWVVPRLGVRAAELMEAPIMFGVSILAARWVVRHVGIPPLWSKRLALGCIALGLMLLVEFTVVLWIRGLTLRGYFETRDPVSGAVYFLTLGAFAVIPAFVGRPRA